MSGPQEPGGDWQDLSDFLAWIYGPERAGQVWVTGFTDISAASWHGVQGLDRLKARLGDNPGAADLYFCIGLMRDGAPRRAAAEVEAQPLLIVDDIGTKVDPAKWEALFALGFPLPSFRIETSPGNQTWGWVLDGDDKSPARWQELTLIRAWFVERKLTDNVMDEARYIRLPGGWNSKPKYRGEGGTGKPPAVRLVGPVIRERVALDDIGRALLGRDDWADAPMPASGMTGVQLGAAIGAGALRRTADLKKPDPLIKLADVIGMNPRQIRAGVVEADCPNMAAHSDRADTGFAFLGGGLAQCQHASCQHLRSTDFRAIMVDRYNDMMAARAAVGADMEGLPGSAVEFLARADFEQHGVNFASVADLTDEAEEIAARRRAREEMRALEHEVAVQRLVGRFVWLSELGVFFDLESRGRFSPDLFDKHPDVVAAGFKPGLSGLKRASNVLLGRDDLRVAQAFTYLPGKPSGLVVAPTQDGAQVDCVNLWMPSRIGLRPEMPRAWLDIVEHVLHDKAYREWFLDWLADRLQNRGVRRPTVPVIVGGQGVGKDVMFIPVIEIIGRHNVRSVSPTMLASSFNQWMLAELVLLPELKLDAGGKLYNNLKDWTGAGANWITINEKYGKPYDVQPTANFCATTNHLDGLAGMETDDRRISVFVSDAKPQRPEWYSAKVAALYDVAELERVHWFLMNRDLRAYNPQAPSPDSLGWKREMIADTLAKPARWVFDECIEDKGQFRNRTLLTLNEVETAALGSGLRSVTQHIGSRAVRDGLLAAGCTQLGRVRAGQDRYRLWFGPGVGPKRRAEIEAMSGKEQAALFLAEQQAALFGPGAPGAEGGSGGN